MSPKNLFQKLSRRILSLPLRFKISIPYLIVATLLAGLATYQVSQSFTTTLETRLRAQLADSAARVAESVIGLEERHLQLLRTIAYTQGFAQALADQDLATMRALAYPVIANEGIPFVEILSPDGTPLLTFHAAASAGNYLENETTTYTAWPIVQQVVAGASDARGDRFAQVIDTPWGLAFYTAGPVETAQDEFAGILLIGTPLSQALLALRNVSVADVSLYAPDGSPAKSTLTLAPANALAPSEQRAIESDPAYMPVRTITAGPRRYLESLAPLYLRGEPTGWQFGISLPEELLTNVQGPSLWQQLLIFTIGVLALIGLGVLVAQLISKPIFRLLDATHQVSEGELDFQLEVAADDELGNLTKGFNLMVEELQQREFIREVFGRMVSEDVREAVLTGQIALGGEQREVTVLFTDVRGFTSLSEKMTPKDVITMLNEFFSVISLATQKNHGIINKFGGDSSLVVFGAPIARPKEETIRQAIRAANDIRLGAALLNAKRLARNQAPLRYGIGLNTGTVVAGNLGTEDRFEYTVIGDPVNVASRLQTLTRQFPLYPILIAGENIEPYKAVLPVHFGDLGTFELKGKENPVPVYAVLEFTTHIPPGFALFDNSSYPLTHHLLVCYLYCLDYPVETIAQALEIEPEIVVETLAKAALQPDIVGKILEKEFHLFGKYTLKLGAPTEPLPTP